MTSSEASSTSTSGPPDVQHRLERRLDSHCRRTCHSPNQRVVSSSATNAEPADRAPDLAPPHSPSDPTLEGGGEFVHPSRSEPASRVPGPFTRGVADALDNQMSQPYRVLQRITATDF